MIEKTKLGAYLRAGTESPKLVEAFGINVPLMIYADLRLRRRFGGLFRGAAGAGDGWMGYNLIIVVFAVVVMGGTGSIMG